ncbi:MAG: class I adenylate-forming enzyme family protein [Bacteroidota bacterium]
MNNNNTIIDAIRLNNQDRLHEIALVENGFGLTYEQLWNRVTIYSKELHDHGISRGKIVVLSFPNSIELSVLFLSLLNIEAVPIIVNELQESAINFEQLNCFGYMAHQKNISSALYKNLINRKSECQPLFENSFLFKNKNFDNRQLVEDTAILITSSGSTSISKVIKLTTQGTIANIKANAKSLGISPFDTTIMALPMNYSYGLIGQFLSHLYTGSKIVLADAKFAITQIPKLISEWNATSLFTVPPMIRQLNYMFEKGFLKGDFSSLRFITIGGNHLEKESLIKAMKTFKCQFVKTYGLAEAGPRVCTHHIGSLEDAEINSVGYPLEGINIRIIDEYDNELPIGEIGRVVIESPSITAGYLNHITDRIKPGKEILTEDLGYISKTGKFYILGRKNDLMEVEGRQIWLQEMASIIYGTGKVLKVNITKKGDYTHITIIPMPACRITDESIFLLLCEHFQFNVWEKVHIKFIKANTVKVVK